MMLIELLINLRKVRTENLKYEDDDKNSVYIKLHLPKNLQPSQD